MKRRRSGAVLALLFAGLLHEDSSGNPALSLWSRSSRVDSVAALMAQGFLESGWKGDSIKAGPIYTLGRIAIDSGGLVLPTPAELLLRRFEGLPADHGNFQSIRKELDAALLDSGHPFALVNASIHIDTLAKEVYPTYTLHPGPAMKFGGFRFSGTRSQPAFLNRYSLLEFGESFALGRVHDAIGRLRRSGYYESVLMTAIYRDSSRHLLYPELRLTDAKVNRITGLAAYSSDQLEKASPLTGLVEIDLRNLRGTGRDLGFLFQSLQDELKMHLEYREPWVWRFPFGAGLSFSVRQQDSVYQELEAEISFSRQLSFRSRYELFFTRQTDAVLESGISRRTQSFGTGILLLLDGRDAAPWTTEGKWLEARTKATHRTDGPQGRYWLSQTARLLQWIPLGGKWLLHQRLQVSALLPWNRAPSRGDLLYLGGTQSLFGYLEDQFPTNLHAFSHYELDYLAGGAARLLVFAAPGWASVPGIDGGVKGRKLFGYGSGMVLGGGQWFVSLIYGLNPERGWDEGLLHVQLENRF